MQNITCMKKLTQCKKVNLAHNKQQISDQHTKHMQQKKLKKKKIQNQNKHKQKTNKKKKLELEKNLMKLEFEKTKNFKFL